MGAGVSKVTQKRTGVCMFACGDYAESLAGLDGNNQVVSK
jgi:hypothetical protein